MRGLPCGVPNRSSAVRMCNEARIAAMIPDHALAALVHERKSSAFALHSPLAFDRFSPKSQ